MWRCSIKFFFFPSIIFKTNEQENFMLFLLNTVNFSPNSGWPEVKSGCRPESAELSSNYSALGSVLDNMLAICRHLCFLPLIDWTPQPLPPPPHLLCTPQPPPHRTTTTAWSKRSRGWNAKQVTCCLSAIFGSGLWHWMRGGLMHGGNG